jgi:hypothetical protein
LEAVDNWRFERRMPTRAAAVRELLGRGLAADGFLTAEQGIKSQDFGILGINGSQREEVRMVSSVVAQPEQLAMLAEVLDDHCLRHKIEDESARAYIAQQILYLFQGGAQTVEEISAGLERLRAAA